MKQLQKKDSRDRMQKYKIKVHNGLNTGNEKTSKIDMKTISYKTKFWRKPE